jgi:radical SAM superfamily enzyme YgiQ (UPF0313 family)
MKVDGVICENRRNRVLLINPHPSMHILDGQRETVLRPPELPMGIAALAAYLEAERIPVQCLDLAVCNDPSKALVKKLQAYQPRYIGITALSTAMPAVEAAADLCRDEVGDDALLIVGGEHASFLKGELLRDHPVFDYLVYGEGEQTLAELVHRLDGGEHVDDVQGLVYRQEKEIFVNDPRPLIEDIDSLPFPARHLLPVERYVPLQHRGDFMRLPSAGIVVSRGCAQELTLSSNSVWGGTSRVHSARRILEEMKRGMKKYGIREFRFLDENLTAPDGPVSELCDLIIRKGLDVTWSCYSRVTGIKKHILAKMKEAGCFQITYGIGFGTEKALKTANLNTTLEQAMKAVDWTKEVGIECGCDFMLGLPGESWSDCETTVKLALELNPDLVRFEVFEAVPGSDMYDKLTASEEGICAYKGEMLGWLDKLASRACWKFYLRIAYLVRMLCRLNRNPKRELRKNWAVFKWLTGSFLTGLRSCIRVPGSWKRADRAEETASPGEPQAIEPSPDQEELQRQRDIEKYYAASREEKSEVIEVDRR